MAITWSLPANEEAITQATNISTGFQSTVGNLLALWYGGKMLSKVKRVEWLPYFTRQTVLFNSEWQLKR